MARRPGLCVWEWGEQDEHDAHASDLTACLNNSHGMTGFVPEFGEQQPQHDTNRGIQVVGGVMDKTMHLTKDKGQGQAGQSRPQAQAWG